VFDFRACEKAGIDPEFVDVHPDDPFTYVVSLNLHRRQLNTSQRSLVAARVRGHFEEEAKKRQREHGGTAPGKGKNTSDQKSGSDDRRKSEASEQAGAALNVSRQSVDRARVVLEHGTPELIAHSPMPHRSMTQSPTFFH
jgi:hypothetical protein